MAISKLFEKFKNNIPNIINVKAYATWKIPQSINKNSTLGEQIKYYRRLAHIKQADLSLKLGYDRGVLDHLENRELKLVNINLIKNVIMELGIADKIVINDEYIKFLLNNPGQTILDFRKKNNLKRVDLAKMIKIDISVIKRWEKGKSQISRTSYEKIKKCMS